MSRIYQSETDTTYQGSARGGSFDPKQAADSSKALQQYKDQISQDFDTQNREQQRRDQAENLQLSKADSAEATGLALQASFDTFGLEQQQLWAKNTLEQQQLFEKGKLQLKADQQKLGAGVAQANTRAITGTIDSLLKFAGSAIQYGENVRAYEESERRRQMLEDAEQLKNARAEALDLSIVGTSLSDFNSSLGVVDAEVDAVSSTVGKIATDLENSPDLADTQAATSLRSESPAVPWLGAQKDVYGAASSHYDILKGLINGLPEAQRPKTISQANAFFQQATRELYKSAGLYALNEDLVREVFLTQAKNNIKLLTQEAVNGANATLKLENKNRSKSIAAEGLANGVPIATIWQDGTAAYSGGSFNAKDNQEFAEFLYSEAARLGRPDLIDDLQNVPKIKGQPNGPTFGDSYGYLANKYKAEANTAREALVQEQYNEVLKNMYAELAQNPNDVAKRTSIASQAADAMDRLDMGEEAKDIRDKIPDLNNPQNQALAIEQLQENIRRGEIVDPEVIENDIRLDGAAKAELKKQLAERQEKIPENEEAEGVLDETAKGYLKQLEIDLGITKSMDGTITYSLGIDAGQSAKITASARAQLYRVARDAVVANKDRDPKEQTAAVRAALTDWYQTNVLNPDGAYNFKPQKAPGAFGSGIAAINAARKQKALDLLASPVLLNDGQMSSKWRESTRQQNLGLEATGVLTPENVEAYNTIRQDTIYTLEAQKELATSYMEAGQMPQSILDNAKKLGISPLALLNQQNLAHNLPTTVYRPPASSPTSLGTQSSTPQEVKSYFISKGLPEASAEYLAGNVPSDMGRLDQTLESLKNVTLPDGRNGYEVFANPFSTDRSRTAVLKAAEPSVSPDISAQVSAGPGALSPSSVKSLAAQVGFTPEEQRIVYAISRGESGSDPTNSTERSGLMARTGEDSVGLMQINWGYHKNRGWLQKLGITRREQLFDPLTNMKAAKYLYDNSGGFSDWTVYNEDIYKDYLY